MECPKWGDGLTGYDVTRNDATLITVYDKKAAKVAQIEGEIINGSI